ncbi:MAG: 50S ribosomal protein L3 [Phycisphaerales bacterium]|nr:50S ribosomal protein L3 [Phycisphaerales bacterium]
MAVKLLGTKIGMTRVFREDGNAVPVTVIQVGPCVVTQLKTVENDGYAAVQIGYGEIKPRNSTIPMIGHDAKAGSAPKRHHREFRVDAKDLAGYQLGQELKVDALASLAFVDVTSVSKGKGFQGVMVRWGFGGQPASHGTERKHRSPGSIGSNASNRGTGTLKRGIRMSGQTGNKNCTIRSLDVVKIDAENNLLLVKGSIPGAPRSLVEISTPARLYRPKARKQRELEKAKK